MTLRIVATDRAPAAIGPYSQAVVSGDLVFCSGQIALDPVSGAVIGDDVAAQTRQVLKNLRAVLEAAGSSLAQVVKCNVYMTDLGCFGEMNAVYGEFFASHRPARAAVEVSRLPKDVLVEIEAVARLD
ncbi:MAG TPA: RidA family protein [Acidobacteria bacterium]|nr:RidA family protein [Acidobacteriota bacterium]